MRKRPILTTVLSIVVVLLAVALIALFQQPSVAPQLPELSYTQLLTLGSQLRDATIRGDVLIGHDSQNRGFRVKLPNDPAIATRLAQGGADVQIGTAADNWQATLLTNLVPLVIYFLLFGLPLFRIARALEALAGRRLDTK